MHRPLFLGDVWKAGSFSLPFSVPPGLRCLGMTDVSRSLAFFAGFLLVLSALGVSRGAYALTGPSQATAYSNCMVAIGNATGELCKLKGTGIPNFASNPPCGVGPPNGDSLESGPSYGIYETNGTYLGPDYHWCVPADCTSYDSGNHSQQYTVPYADGDADCSNGCLSKFHGADGIATVTFGDGSGGSFGYFAGDGSGGHCVASTDASLLAKLSPGDMTCDNNGRSCYSPTKGFCATTESGEQVCVPAPPAGQGSCASGATGAACAGNGTPPPSPPDPPIAKNTPPDQTTTATAKDSSGDTYNYTTNNYSGTSPGPGAASSSGDTTSGTSGSNQNGSGNSPGPDKTHGTNTSGKCPDGSVPTASGCSGTATDNGCDTPPACFGDAVMCASFREEVAIRCNTAKAASGSSSGSSNIGDPASALAGAGVPADGGASGDPSTSGLVSSSDLGEDGFDASGLGFSRTCPANPAFDVLGHSYTLDLTPMCNFASLLGWFVLLVASLVGLRIVATGKA